ncbi:MAG TPA: hypothetical protein VFO93_00530 [Hymenobacter sp.]|uniref:hypothetical protein n=1 Tax=Hymenobacter sp. TaxID=1898978 RepID=UPI002D7E891B|nr:hypothetical protein [Hymenobacter sp.]HET9501993.1 hypothetical protein [Hymenobacter sp.]
MRLILPKTNSYWRHLAAALLLTARAQAQVPAELLGRWEAYEIGFTVPNALPDSVRDRLNDPNTAALNHALAEGTTHLRVEFRADGGYQFTVTRGEEVVQSETGTYTVVKGRLQASSPSSRNGSSFDGHEIRKLSRRVLLLGFPVGEYMPGVDEEVEYRRVK